MIRPVVIPESIPSDPYAWELIGIPAGDIALLIYRTARAVTMLIEEHDTLIRMTCNAGPPTMDLLERSEWLRQEKDPNAD